MSGFSVGGFPLSGLGYVELFSWLMSYIGGSRAQPDESSLLDTAFQCPGDFHALGTTV